MKEQEHTEDKPIKLTKREQKIVEVAVATVISRFSVMTDACLKMWRDYHRRMFFKQFPLLAAYETFVVAAEDSLKDKKFKNDEEYFEELARLSMELIKVAHPDVKFN